MKSSAYDHGVNRSVFVWGILAVAVWLSSCGDAGDEATTDSRSWAVTVANSLGGPGKVAEAYARAKTDGEPGKCTLKLRAAASPGCVYGAALAGCYAGQTGGPTYKRGGVVPMRNEPKLRAVYDLGFRACGGQLGDGPFGQ
jgi:hypothetical protein